MSTDERLKQEIRKWSARLDETLVGVHAESEKGVEYLTNVKAYQEDSLHFIQKNDLVRAFEALLWAWAYLTIAKDLGLVVQRSA